MSRPPAPPRHTRPEPDEIDPSEVRNPVVCKGWEMWNRLRGTRLFPAREQLSPRVLSGIARHIALIKVVDEGRDFEFRVIGDAIVLAQGVSHHGMKMTEIDPPGSPQATDVMVTYREVVASRVPVAFRGLIRRPVDGKMLFRESLILPLGATDDAVDHILAILFYSPPPDSSAN